LSAVRQLEDVPDNELDWHPGSNGKVLDLVHPSLYPIVFGRTLVSPQHTPAQVKEDLLSEAGNTVSKDFAWLPTDFSISADGKVAHALSYINNIHPSNTKLANIIEHLVARFVPLFDRVLTDSLTCNYYSFFPLRQSDAYLVDNTGEPQLEDFEDYGIYSETEYEWRTTQRGVLLPYVKPYQPDTLNSRCELFSICGRTVQIIVKLANIVLTPESPKYGGGSWHVEGMRNESIVASGIYYYGEE
jgi:hypothetical protein